jgi:hypothetical protein
MLRLAVSLRSNYSNSYTIDDTISRIQNWLAPPPFASTLNDNLKLLKEDTGNWFLSHPRFEEWYKPPDSRQQTGVGKFANMSDSRTLWVHGTDIPLSNNLIASVRH